MKLLLALSLALSSACASPILANTPAKSDNVPMKPLDQRIEQLPAVLSGLVNYEEYFSPTFLAAVPPAQLKALSDQFIAQYGKPEKIIAVEMQGTNGATIKIEFEKAIATALITVESGTPQKVVGLLITGFDLKGDTPAKIDAAFAELPGKAGYLVEKIDASGQRSQVAGRATGQQFAIASTFKLYILAELASQIQAGRRSWSEVVPILANSHSSNATINWPRTTPVTLQTLATWMISSSDNTATDALMRVLGRDAVEQKLAAIGHSDPDKALPMLNTVEAFVLKSNAELRKRFENASEAEQRNLLAKEATAFGFDKIDPSGLGSGPVAIDSIEWFASPADIGNLLRNIRQTGNQTMLDIMAVNKGVAPVSADKWQYLGYKGGSEPGVISMSFLAQSKAGEWYTITGSWNNNSKDVDNMVFASLMGRLLDSVAGQ